LLDALNKSGSLLEFSMKLISSMIKCEAKPVED
jgi:hypothetical protein